MIVILNTITKFSTDESEILQIILKESKNFKNFYENERHKIRVSVLWLDNKLLPEDEKLPNGHLARAYWASSGEWIIVVRNIPAIIEEDSIIAHEIAHCVIQQEGFPSVGQYPGCTDPIIFNLAFSLNNMLQDPLVIRMLVNYGFPLQEEYDKECVEVLQRIRTVNKNPIGIQRIIFTMHFIQHLLETEILFENGPCLEYTKEFGEKYPDIVEKADPILTKIHQIGYNTPHKLREIFTFIIEEWQLSELIEIFD